VAGLARMSEPARPAGVTVSVTVGPLANIVTVGPLADIVTVGAATNIGDRAHCRLCP
jgi:hypothetical protein